MSRHTYHHNMWKVGDHTYKQMLFQEIHCFLMAAFGRHELLDLLGQAIQFLLYQLIALPANLGRDGFSRRAGAPQNLGLVMRQTKVQGGHQGLGLIHQGHLALKGSQVAHARLNATLGFVNDQGLNAAAHGMIVSPRTEQRLDAIQPWRLESSWVGHDQ